MEPLRDLYRRIEPDPVRASLPFEPDFRGFQEALLRASSDVERGEILRTWLSRYQPCLFGKIAAKSDALGFCFLTDALLEADDSTIEDHIRRDRLHWKRAAFRGEKSGFVLLALSERLAIARPDSNLMAFAQKLAELYLLREDIVPDSILLDSLSLEIPRPGGSHAFQWDVGINVFASAGDGRWWQDHRIPGGLAFSLNSVGHMVKSIQLNDTLDQLLKLMDVDGDNVDLGKVTSLDAALTNAMLTISNASIGPSGPATWLVDVGADDSDSCPHSGATHPRKLEGKVECKYRGLYHTDVTIPASYFRDDIAMPDGAESLELDFSYLYVNRVTNPAFRTMGVGEQIRGDDSTSRTIRSRKGHKNWGKPLSENETNAERDSLAFDSGS